MPSAKERIKKALPSWLLLIRRYWKAHGVLPNLVCPATFNEKVLYRIIFDRRPVLAQLADKAAARSYVESRLGPGVLPELYCLTTRPETIPFDRLPNCFVVKPTHGCGWVQIVKDKSALDRGALIESCTRWLNQSYYEITREWVYKDIRPQIMVEEFVEDGSGTRPSDYRFFVFGGTVELIQVDLGHLITDRVRLYTPAWARIAPGAGSEVPRPARLAEMLAAARILGGGLDFVRVDFFATATRLYVGELTTSPEGAMGRLVLKDLERHLGGRWKLPRFAQLRSASRSSGTPGESSDARTQKVSIIIVNHNYARFLRQAIDSALSQTYTNTEVIVVDDGSTDDSSAIIQSYGSQIIRILKGNAGQLSCYYSGFAACSGDLVLYLDADDFLYPECVSEVIAHWQPGCVKAHYYLDVVDEGGARMDAVVPSGCLGKGKSPLKMMRLFGTYCSPPASGNVYSRDFLARILTPENQRTLRNFYVTSFSADAIPIFAAPYFGTIVAIPRTLACYRRHRDAAAAVISQFEVEADLQKLERDHQKDLLRDRGWRLAIGRNEASRLSEPSRLKRRFCYLRLSGRGLIASDRRLTLVAKGVWSCLWWNGYSWTQKVAISAWFLGMAILPSGMVRALIRPALGISDRTPRLRQFLQVREGRRGRTCEECGTGPAA